MSIPLTIVHGYECRLKAITFQFVCTDWNSVGIPADNCIVILVVFAQEVLRILGPNEDVMGLECGMLSDNFLPQVGLEAVDYLPISLHIDPVDRNTVR